MVLVIGAAAAPGATAQQLPYPCDTDLCSTEVEMTVTPTGTWGDDGFLDDQDEIATFDVVATAHFSPNSVCATPNDILFQMFTTEFTRSNITPSRHTVDIPANGGDVTVRSKLELYLLRGTPPLSVEGIILRVIVQDCGYSGAQERAQADVTVAVISEIRPSFDVEFRQPDLHVGLFEFDVLNTGNANLVVEGRLVDALGVPVLPADVPEPTRVFVGAIGHIVVRHPTDLPGNYSVRLEGRWAGDPANTSLPRAEYDQAVEIVAPPVTATPSGNAPATGLLAAFAAAACALAARRRIRF